MIPKIVHYAWIGGEKPESVVRNINRWKRILPDYKFIEWNEKNWDVNYDNFSKYFYDLGKRGYGFVSDVVRLYALYNFGGVYMDTDVHLNKNFDSLLNESLVLGRIYDNAIGTATILSEKKNPVVGGLLKYYNSLDLPKIKSSDFDKVNNGIFTRYFIEEHSGMSFSNKMERLHNNVLLLPKQYFEIPSFWYEKGGYAVHEQVGSWVIKSDAANFETGVKSNIKALVKFMSPTSIIRYQNIKAGKNNSIALEFGNIAPK